MSKVFISYRREDSGYVVGMLAEKLQERFGRDAVFLDIDNIPLGFDFRDHITQAVGQCDVVLAVIGDSWINSSSDNGRRRIDVPADFVRLELEAALTRHIPVIPVLVGSAKMPEESELPASLQGLAFRNAAEIRAGRDLQHHIEVLTRGIESLIPTQPDARTRPSPGTAVPRSGGGGVSTRQPIEPPATSRESRPATIRTPETHREAPVLWIALLLNALGGWGLFYADPRWPRRRLYPSVILPALVATVIIASATSDNDWEPILLICLFVFVCTYVASFVAVVRAWRSGRHPVAAPAISRQSTPIPEIHGEPPVLWIALLLNILGGCGLFYADPYSLRRAVYPSVILAALFFAIVIPSVYPSYMEIYGFRVESWVGLFVFLIIAGYLASYVAVVRAVRSARRRSQLDT